MMYDTLNCADGLDGHNSFHFMLNEAIQPSKRRYFETNRFILEDLKGNKPLYLLHITCRKSTFETNSIQGNVIYICC